MEKITELRLEGRLNAYQEEELLEYSRQVLAKFAEHSKNRERLVERMSEQIIETDVHAIQYRVDETHIEPDIPEHLYRKRVISELLDRLSRGQDADEVLWKAVIAYQNYPFYTSSGLPFSYTVKRKRNGEYSGELLVSRKEGSKTLTKSSVMLAFYRVLEKIADMEAAAKDENVNVEFNPPEYKGPKAIGQIFGISYIYSLFWELGLIAVPEKVEAGLKGKISGS